MALEPLRAGNEKELLDLAAKVGAFQYDESLEEAKGAVLDAVESCKDKKNKKGEACALFALTMIRMSQNEPWLEVLKGVGEAIKLFKEVGDKSQAGKVQLALSKSLLTKKKEEALRWGKEAVVTFKDAKDKAFEAKALQVQAMASLEMGNLDAARSLATDAMKLCKDVSDKAGEAYAQYLLAAVQLSNNLPQEATETAKSAITLAKTAKDSGAQASATLVCVESSLALGALDDAKTLALETLGLFDSDDADRKTEASLMHAVAKACLSSDADQAAQYAEQAMTLSLLLGDVKGELAAIQTAAAANLQLNKYDAALTLAMQGVMMASEMGDKVAEAKCLQVTSDARLARGRPGEALMAARKAGEIYSSLKDKASKRLVDKAIIKIEGQMPPPHRPTNILQTPSVTGKGAVPNNIMNIPRNVLVWNNTMKEGAYPEYLLELLKFVNDVVTSPSESQILICSKSTVGRQVGEIIPCQKSDTESGSLWGVVRTIRLEQPRLKISSVDISPDMDANEIARSICDAAEDTGPREEVAYCKVLDPVATRDKMGIEA